MVAPSFILQNEKKIKKIKNLEEKERIVCMFQKTQSKTFKLSF